MTSQKQSLPYHLLRILAGWFFFAIIIAAFAISGVRMSRLSRDPAELADIPIYYGLLSNFGILIWAAAAFISFFASFHVQGAKLRSLLCWSGILTTVLLLDDFFLVHDVIFPDVLGLPQWLIYPCYMIAFPLFFVSHLKTIFADTEYRILALGVFLMGLSVLVDIDFLPGGIDVEDSLKLSGMIAYSYYWILTAHHSLACSDQGSLYRKISD